MEILALLDKPSSQSFGMVPVIVQSGDGAAFALDGHAYARSVTRHAVDALCASGHAYDVSGLQAKVDGEPRPLVAGWLGTEFLANARAIGAPEPVVPETQFVLEPYGSFWVDAPAIVFASLKNWTLDAARRACADRNAALAELMEWALPHEQETIAAVWWTRGSDEERKQYLRMIEHVHRGRRQPFDMKTYESILGSIVQMYVARPKSGE